MPIPASTALHSLQITLGRWEKPSSWDMVMADDDDPPKGKFVSTVGCNMSANGTISVPVGTVFTTGTNLFISTGFEEAGRIAQHEDERVLRDLNSAAEGTGSGGQRPGLSTSYEDGNRPMLPPHAESIPYPRNGKEKRILKSMGDKLAQAIRKVEAVLGKRVEARSKSEWNAAFWKMVTHRGAAVARRDRDR